MTSLLLSMGSITSPCPQPLPWTLKYLAMPLQVVSREWRLMWWAQQSQDRDMGVGWDAMHHKAATADPGSSLDVQSGSLWLLTRKSRHRRVQIGYAPPCTHRQIFPCMQRNTCALQTCLTCLAHT